MGLTDPFLEILFLNCQNLLKSAVFDKIFEILSQNVLKINQNNSPNFFAKVRFFSRKLCFRIIFATRNLIKKTRPIDLTWEIRPSIIYLLLLAAS